MRVVEVPRPLVVAAADPLARDVARGGELADDVVRSAFGDPDAVADLAQADAGVVCDARVAETSGDAASRDEYRRPVLRTDSRSPLQKPKAQRTWARRPTAATRKRLKGSRLDDYQRPFGKRARSSGSGLASTPARWRWRITCRRARETLMAATPAAMSTQPSAIPMATEARPSAQSTAKT